MSCTNVVCNEDLQGSEDVVESTLIHKSNISSCSKSSETDCTEEPIVQVNYVSLTLSSNTQFHLHF